MNNKLTPALDMYAPTKPQPIARISLNGYDIKAGGLLPSSGAMRSFVIQSGDLWEYWNACAPLMLHNETGLSVSVRIAALPMETGGYGLLEFL
jgi:hypothetical protein